jgi:hypothetical protein
MAPTRLWWRRCGRSQGQGACASRAPACLVLDGHLALFVKREVTALPLGPLRCRGLMLAGCRSLAALPNALQVRGNLVCSGCAALARLPEGLVVDGLLQLDGCSALPSSGALALPSSASWRKKKASTMARAATSPARERRRTRRPAASTGTPSSARRGG